MDPVSQSRTREKTELIRETHCKRKLVFCSIRYSAHPCLLWKANICTVCIRSTVHCQDVSVPPKYQRIQSVALKYTANNSDILSTQCSTLELILVTGSSGRVCIAPECDKWDHVNCVSSISEQPVVTPKI